jgi:hypothetical protein
MGQSEEKTSPASTHIWAAAAQHVASSRLQPTTLSGEPSCPVVLAQPPAVISFSVAECPQALGASQPRIHRPFEHPGSWPWRGFPRTKLPAHRPGARPPLPYRQLDQAPQGHRCRIDWQLQALPCGARVLAAPVPAHR